MNTEAARTVISSEYKEHFVPVENLCDQVEVMHINVCKQAGILLQKQPCTYFQWSIFIDISYCH